MKIVAFLLEFFCVMLFLLWCSCVCVWYASPDRVSHCAEVRQENIFFARPYPHATWSKQEKRGATCVVHSTGRGEKKKNGNKPLSIYSAISPFKRFVCLYHAYWNFIVDGKLKYMRVVETCICWRLCFVLDALPVFSGGAMSAKSVFRSVDFAEKKWWGVGVWPAP